MDLTFGFYDFGMSLEAAAAHSHHIPPDEQKAIDHIITRLQDVYEALPSHVVAQAVHEIHARYGSAKIRDFVPMFVERHAREWLSIRD